MKREDLRLIIDTYDREKGLGRTLLGDHASIAILKSFLDASGRVIEDYYVLTAFFAKLEETPFWLSSHFGMIEGSASYHALLSCIEFIIGSDSFREIHRNVIPYVFEIDGVVDDLNFDAFIKGCRDESVMSLISLVCDYNVVTRRILNLILDDTTDQMAFDFVVRRLSNEGDLSESRLLEIMSQAEIPGYIEHLSELLSMEGLSRDDLVYAVQEFSREGILSQRHLQYVMSLPAVRASVDRLCSIAAPVVKDVKLQGQYPSYSVPRRLSFKAHGVGLLGWSSVGVRVLDSAKSMSDASELIASVGDGHELLMQIFELKVNKRNPVYAEEIAQALVTLHERNFINEATQQLLTRTSDIVNIAMLINILNEAELLSSLNVQNVINLSFPKLGLLAWLLPRLSRVNLLTQANLDDLLNPLHDCVLTQGANNELWSQYTTLKQLNFDVIMMLAREQDGEHYLAFYAKRDLLAQSAHQHMNDHRREHGFVR